jgi:hypothetical protein
VGLHHIIKIPLCEFVCGGLYRALAALSAGKDTSQASTLHGRPKDPRPDNTPAPGDYSPEKSDRVLNDCSPKYTFGVKTQHEKPSTTPGESQ